jgi:hypothetical protein
VKVGTAEKVLTVGGLSLVAYGFLLGVPISMIRMKSPHVSRHLITAHLAAIIQGALLLGMSRAVMFSTLAANLETAASALLLTGVALFDLGATANWLQGVGDHFAERSLGWKLLAMSAPLNLSAAGVFLFGVVRAL